MKYEKGKKDVIQWQAVGFVLHVYIYFYLSQSLGKLN